MCVVQPTLCSTCIFRKGTDLPKMLLISQAPVSSTWWMQTEPMEEMVQKKYWDLLKMGVEGGVEGGREGGRMLSPCKTFPSQGREMQLNVLRTFSAVRPVSCHLSDSRRQEKLCPYWYSTWLSKGLANATPHPLCQMKEDEFTHREAETLSEKQQKTLVLDFSTGLDKLICLHQPLS